MGFLCLILAACVVKKIAKQMLHFFLMLQQGSFYDSSSFDAKKYVSVEQKPRY